MSIAAAESTTGDFGADMLPDHDDDISTDAMVPDVMVTIGNRTDDIQKSKGPSEQKFGHTQPNTKRSKRNADEEIDVNRCYVCFALYGDNAGTGREWLQC